jgi:hypothetical protein
LKIKLDRKMADRKAACQPADSKEMAETTSAKSAFRFEFV